MSAPLLEVTAGDGVATIALASPPANALSLPLLEQLADALDATGVRLAGAVVIRSALPRFFAAGADLKLMATLDRDGFAAYLGTLRDVLDAIAALPQPTIAELDGLALGGGLELALACTLRVAGPGAGLGLPEVRLGLLPGAGGTQRLPRLVGDARASDLLLTGRTVGAEEALRIGLVDRLAEDAASCAAELAADIARHSAAARAIGRCVTAASGHADAGMRIELDELLDLFDSDAGRAGVAAFVARSAERA